MLKLSNAFWGQSKSSDFASLDLLKAGARAGIWRQASSGFWELDAFGAEALSRLEARQRGLMSRLGSHQARFSLLQEQELWDATGRDKDYGEELYGLVDRRGRRMRLAATAEEAATRAATEHAQAGGARSMWCHQIGDKWRDETRARGGLSRSREFRMLDAYSFCQNIDEARDIHQATLAAWLSELEALGLSVEARQADCGEVGGLESVEIVARSEAFGDERGELELAHLFLLGDRYSRAFGLRGKDGSFMQMGCQGLGTTRLLAALCESRRRDTGFFGDEAFHARLFWVCALDFQADQAARTLAMALMEAGGGDAILDDRDLAAGRKLREAEMGLCAHRLVSSRRLAAQGMVEVRSMDGSLSEAWTLDRSLSWMKERRVELALR